MRGFRLLAALAALAAGASAPAPAAAQEAYPSQAVRILVPYPAGGGVDIVTRTLGDELAKRWRQSVIVENRPGAGGTIASQVLAKSSPDGHTLIVVASGHAINPFLYAKLPYDTFGDFTPISLHRLVAEHFAGARQFANQNPGRPAGAGAGAARRALLRHGGHRHVDASCRRAVEAHGEGRHRGDPLQRRRAGDQRPDRRAHPDVVQQRARRRSATSRAARCARSASPPRPARRSCPTCRRSPRPACRATTPACGGACLAPGGLPPAVGTKLHRDIVEALRVPAVKERLSGFGATPDGSSPQEFATLIRADHDKWGPVIKAAGIKGE